MTKKSCYGNGRAACDPRRDQYKISRGEGEATKDGQSSRSSSCSQATKKTTWKRYLTFLSKFQNKMKHKIKPEPGDAKATAGSKQQNPKRYSSLLQECSNLVRIAQRTTAGCFAAAMAMASEAGDEDELTSYVQLDQVSYGVKREAFGPIYLVT
ncbi:hypothetical protein PR202_gb07852 [Eleusine coracana subsp. coracana]|uniref:Uncharacterized protein n=1 Tax=Eleusine coracana subsp. coracana TaxID=191504 RepID=A0AAV5ED65_ELECO|nr:hypothetical protein QOZ80_2BG0178100 [Eleusine coracana subsp. coracana]GJN20471.1 hypothetical protein PR202_gb07852 [Eleusine coracana subsp. coracana]